MDFLQSCADLSNFTLYDSIIPCTTGGRRFRPDVLYVINDRWVILEIDEHEHKYANPVCEYDRLNELRDELQQHDTNKYMVVVRYNPNEAYNSLHDKHIELAQELRDAFTTRSVMNAERGMELRYIGYSNKRLKILDDDVLERYGSEFKGN
jgi:hypothetical protein